MQPDIQGAGLEAGAVGACTTCMIAIGFDPVWAPVGAAVAVFGGRIVVGLVESWLRNRRASSSSSSSAS